MKLKYLTIIGFLFPCSIILSQETASNKYFISLGITKVPLHIQRTDKFRTLTFPAFELGFRINEKMYARTSYLYHDLKIYRGEERRMFVETPSLTSYEIASMHIGKKFTLSQFSDYLFVGIKYEYIDKTNFNLFFGCDFGFRFGGTSVIASVSEQPSWPNGFELHSNYQSSNSPGLRLSISPQIILWDLVYLESSFGSYLFTNWPIIQPFGTMQLGFSF